MNKLTTALAGAAALAISMGAALAEPPRGLVSFKEDIYPIIQIRCLSCHKPGGEGLEASGLDLTSYEGLMKGTRYGPVVLPGKSMMSNLIVLVDGRAAIRMPHNKRRLSTCEIGMLKTWVNQGARNN